ncbi:S8 family serine peptidase [Streptosporangium sp. NPDC049376]|uniref:S8 family serine peptidase n=1 Tax=Streptosporangium sp. NPDC049376 TaxID=3366192 RepID=UPI00378AD4D5
MIFGKPFLAVALAATALGVTPTPPSQPPQPADGVTLITGDRVVIVGRGHRIIPGPGRTEVVFASRTRDGHLHVTPSDAQPLIAKGVLDPRLFDVTQLLQWRYGDADTPDIPLITRSENGPAPALGSARGLRRLDGLGMAAFHLPKNGAAQAWKDLAGGRTLAPATAKIWLDGRRSFSLDRSTAQIGAPEAWKQGLTGKDVTVAVLDSGYDPDHPDLKGVVTQERNFSEDPDIRDTLGHGTHVASIVAGNGEKYRGVAPGARLAIGKVGGELGPSDSAVLAGMEWAAREVKAKIVNMSLGYDDQPGIDPVEEAVNTLSAETGTLFVVAAGNDGGSLPVSSPAGADAALAVGAVDRRDQVAYFSSLGPRIGDHAVKPDLTAPGTDIVAAAAQGTADGPHVAASGTSMASPHVAGAAAILAQRHPDWTGQRLKAALVGSARPTSGATPYQQGTGRVDVGRALRQQVTAQSEGTWAAFPWKGPDGREKTGTITYANAGETPVSLDLTVEGDVLRLGTQRLDVPAGGQASVTVTVDAAGKAPGEHVGTVTATSGDTVVRTFAGAYVEPESYDVTVNALDRQGQPVDPWMAEIYDAKSGKTMGLAFQNGTATVRLAKGDWNLFTETAERVDGRSSFTTAVSPFKVDGADLRLTTDARQGRAAGATLDDPTAERQRGFDLGLVHGAWSSTAFATADVGSQRFVPVRLAGLTYDLHTTWLSKDVTPSPYVYDLVDHHTDGLPDNPVYDARKRDLAKITTTYRASGTAATGAPMSGRSSDKFPGTLMGIPVGGIPLPGTLVHYRTPGVAYEDGLQVGGSIVFGAGGLARRGQTGETVNAAVTGPSFLLPNGGRTGDELLFTGAGMFADGGRERTGSDSAATGTATLTGDGKTLATADLVDCDAFDTRTCELRTALPAGPGTYTLTASMRRQVPYSTLSTAVESAWTFRSATTAKEQPLPLTAVRYGPAGLDPFNRAKPGSLTRLPLWLDHNPGSSPSAGPSSDSSAASSSVSSAAPSSGSSAGSSAGTSSGSSTRSSAGTSGWSSSRTSIRLEMSVDDGAHWRRIPVIRTGSGWTSMVPNPRTPGFVSLRATVTDPSGTDLTQTITRAYAIG